MLELCRKWAFLVMDGLRGGPVRHACRELKKWDSVDAQSPELKAYHEARLGELMAHAQKTTEFYRENTAQSIEQMPVINKATIKQQQDAFLSSDYEKDKLITMYTSGSTGTPLVSYQDGRKKKKVNAECIYYSQKIGYDVGKPLIYLRAAVKQIKKSKLMQFVQNQPLISCKDLSDAGIEALLDTIAQAPGKNKSLIAYASTFDAFAEYFIKTGKDRPKKDPGVIGMISGAEMLYDQTRESLERYFGCRCVSRYSNEENGVLAQDDGENNVFLLNEAHYYIEVLKLTSDEPAAPGEVGRVVVTDLFNYAMPMIRYDTGDIGAMTTVTYHGVAHRALDNFGGRKCDSIADCAGNRLSPHAVTNLLWSFTDIKQFQFIQEDVAAYHIVVNPEKEFDREQELIDALQYLVGAEAKVTVSYVSEIPILSSGKRKYIVNKLLEG